MKKNFDVIFTLLFVLAALVLTACDTLGQNSTTLTRPCTGFAPSPKKALVEIDKDGGISLVPCQGRSVLIGGSSPGSFINSINGQTALAQTFAPPAASDTANWFSAAGAHTLRLPITSVSGAARSNYFPLFDGDNALKKSPLQYLPSSEFRFNSSTGDKWFSFQPNTGQAIIGDDDGRVYVDGNNAAVGIYGTFLTIRGKQNGMEVDVDDDARRIRIGNPTWSPGAPSIVLDSNDLFLKNTFGGSTHIGDPDGDGGGWALSVFDDHIELGRLFNGTSVINLSNGVVSFYGSGEADSFDTSFMEIFRLSKTKTAGGTVGNQTINKVSGTVNFAAGAGAAGITVTNNTVNTNSLVFATAQTNDTTCSVKSVVPGDGSFVIRMSSNCTAETSVAFFVTN